MLHSNKGNFAVVRWDKTKKRVIKNIILTDPARIYKVPVSNEELAYLYSLSHEFGHIYDFNKRQVSYDIYKLEENDSRKVILSENRAWFYAYKLLLFLYKGDRMVLSEFNKHYEHCIRSYVRELK
jgi:hypothetical protein